MKIGFCQNCGRAIKVDTETGDQRRWDRMATQTCVCWAKPKKKKGGTMHKDRITLENMCGGSVQEKFNRALKRVTENILDPNMDPEKKRTITIKFTFVPNEKDPEQVAMGADVTVSLPPEAGVGTMMFMSKDLETGKSTVIETRKGELKGQLDFSDVGFMDEEEEVDEETGEITGNVIDMRRAN